MDSDTDFGGPAAYPATRCSVVRATGDSDAAIRKQALETLVAAYWKPVYKYIRIRWNRSNDQAKDLTQSFFARAIERDFLTSFDPAKARFRTFLRICADRFIANDDRAANRLKRGGSLPQNADGELLQQVPAVEASPDELFRIEWVRTVFGLAVDDLQEQCLASGKETHFKLFRRYDLEGADNPSAPTYAQLGQEFGLPVTQVTNYLAAARRQFRALVVERIRATTGSDEEFQEECRQLFGGVGP